MTRPRRAASLVELLVVMTLSTVAISLGGALVCRVMRIQLDSRTHADVERNSLRLAEQFRRDVHSARSAVTRGTELEGGLLDLRFADGRQARYSREGETVLRQSLAPGGPASREEFEFPATCQVSIEQQGPPSQLTLTITTGPVPSFGETEDQKPIGRIMGIPASLQVTSMLGRDLRFGGTAAETEASE